MEDKLLTIFKNVFEDEYVTCNINQETYDNWDSLRQLNLIVEIENEFGIEFEPEEMGKMKSFKIIEEMVSEKIK